MRPRFGPAIAARAASSTAGPSRWTHRVGVSELHDVQLTPTSRLDALDAGTSTGATWHEIRERIVREP